MNKKVYSWSNPKPVTPSHHSRKSCTIPTQTMSIRTIMDRYARGMPLSQHIKNPIYHDGEFPDVQGLDLTEIAALQEHAKQQIDFIQKDLQQQEKTKQTQATQQLTNQIEELKKQLEEQGTQGRAKAPLNPIS